MKKYGLIIVALLFVSIIGSFYVPQTAADGEDWLTGWDYRRTVDINGSAGAGTNYQVNLTVVQTANMQPDFDDIRFTDNDGDTLLDYWLEDYHVVGFDNIAWFWVNVTDNLDTDQTIYMYYGNDVVSTTSDGVSTFPFFDDFNDESVNVTLWDTTWVAGGSVVEAGGIITVDGTDGAQSLGAKVEFGTGHAYEYLAKIDEQDTVTLGADERSTDGTSVGSYDTADILFSTTKKYRTAEEGVQDTDARAEDFSTYQRLSICRNAATDTRFFIGGLLKHTMSAEIPDEDMGVMIYVVGASSEAFMDWTFVRKYIVVEPAFSAWGEEETAPPRSWNTVGDVDLIFPIGWHPVATFGYNAAFIFLGLIMIPLSTIYLVRGGRKGASMDKLFYGLIIFMVGFGLLVGGIMP